MSGWYKGALVLGLAVLVGCAPIQRDVVREPSTALPAAHDTPSARYVQSEVNKHAEASGFRLLTDNTNALMSRIALADHAAHSIDLQYFIFQNDATGRLVAQRLLAAADRGVRVRMLLDDYALNDEYDLLDALDAHANIEVRVFNPFRTRAKFLPAKIIQFVLEWRRLNRRMHNKSFIVDGNVAVIGGRNIGDAYFDAADTSNFRDLDVIAIGPVVAEASRSFDAYWNSEASVPVSASGSKRNPQRDLSGTRDALAHEARAFAESDYAQAAIKEFPSGPTADRAGSWFWGEAVLVADQPEKIEARGDEPILRIGPKLKQVIDTAQREVLFTSPYFVPGTNGVDYLSSLVARGVTTKVLTNSLAATDEPAAHAAYSRYRRDLLNGGVQLYELHPVAGTIQAPTAYGTSSGISLHAKSIVVDRHRVFIGSMNMDQRSKLLNTEMGVIVDSQGLAAAVADFFDRATAPENAFRVELKPEATGRPEMEWITLENGRMQTFGREPGASAHRKVEALFLRLLPIDGLM
jgi:putative cardiolipin synthase